MSLTNMNKEDAVDTLFNNKDPELWKKYQEGDTKVAGQILKDLSSTIDNAVHKFAADDQSFKTQARILALDAVKSYDPSKGASLNTYVYNNLQRLNRISAQRGNLTKIPEGAALQRAALMKARRDYEIDNGEEPTVEELAAMTGFSRKRINDLANYSPTTPDSITVSPEGDSLVATDNTRALDLYDKFIYNDLDRIDKKIYEWSTGYGGSPKLSRGEMAQKLNISQAAVSKRAANISNKFNKDRAMIERMFYKG